MQIHFMNTDSPIERHSSRRQEKDGRRQRILAAAEAAFSAGGYHNASLAVIARQADLAVGTLYLYFADKADLYGHVILEKMNQITERFEQALASGDSAAECLRAAVHSQFAFHDANRHFFEIFLHQHQVHNSPLHARHWEELEELKRRILVRIEECVARGQRQNELKAGDTRLYAVAFLGVTLQIIRQWIREQTPGRLSDSADFAANFFLHGASQS
jgi:TetR/AcrR family fatty acid metabolism transcriptional regulator